MGGDPRASLMAVSVKTIRQRVAASITSELGGSGFTESRYHYDRFGRDARSLVHRSFAVGMLETTFVDQRRRTRTAGGVNDLESGTRAVTRFGVQWAHHLAGDGHVEDTDTALGEEHQVVKAVAGMVKTGTGSPVPARIRRFETGEGTYLITLAEFEIAHLYDVSAP